MPNGNGNGERRRILSVVVGDTPGVLARIISLVTGRGYNINSLTVGPMRGGDGRPLGTSRITIVVSADDQLTQQIMAQIDKQVETHGVLDLTDLPTLVEADVTLVKVWVNDVMQQAALMTIATMSFRAISILMEPEFAILRFTGRADASAAFIRAMTRFGKVESVYSGTVAIA